LALLIKNFGKTFLGHYNTSWCGKRTPPIKQNKIVVLLFLIQYLRGATTVNIKLQGQFERPVFVFLRKLAGMPSGFAQLQGGRLIKFVSTSGRINSVLGNESGY